MSGIQINSAGRRLISASGKRILAASGVPCCCSAYRIQRACKNCPGSLENLNYVVAVDPSHIGKRFWGDNYTAYGLEAGVMYQISAASASYTVLPLSLDDLIEHIYPSAVEGIGISTDTGCKNTTIEVSSGNEFESWSFSNDGSTANAYVTIPPFSYGACRGFYNNGGFIDDEAYIRRGEGCTGGTFHVQLRHGIFCWWHQDRLHFASGMYGDPLLGVYGIVFLWFYGSIDSSETASSAYSDITNELAFQDDPLELGECADFNILGTGDPYKSLFFAVGQGGILRIYW